VTDTVTNEGAVASGVSTTRYYLSRDSMKDAGDRRLTGLRGVPALEAGGSSTGSVIVKVPAATPLDTYWLLACADDKKVITEINETNNCRPSTTPVVVALPDLVTPAVSDPPEEGSPGERFTLSDTVHNIGAAPAAASTTRYYLSVDTLADPLDVLLTGTRGVLSLLSGGTSTGAKKVTVPFSTPVGTYHVLACADDILKVTEATETNNCAASGGTILIGWSDLMTTMVSDPPPDAPLGGTFVVTDTVVNAGTVAARASTMRYYLSLDASKGAGDILLTGTRSVVSLAAAAGSTGTKAVTVPLGTAAGTYHVLSCADDLLKVSESNEDNNCHASAARISIHP
jgi:subtilase family serine protease